MRGGGRGIRSDGSILMLLTMLTFPDYYCCLHGPDKRFVNSLKQLFRKMGLHLFVIICAN